MKVVIFVLASILAVQAVTDEQQKRVDKLSGECLKVSNVDVNVLKQASKGAPYPDDPKLRIHAFCFSKKIDLQDDKGEFQPDVIRDRLNVQMKDKAEVETLLRMCLVQKKTPEEGAFDSLACFQKNMPKDVVVY